MFYLIIYFYVTCLRHSVDYFFSSMMVYIMYDFIFSAINYVCRLYIFLAILFNKHKYIMYTESRKEWDFYASLRDKVDGSGNDFAEDMQRVQSVPKMLS